MFKKGKEELVLTKREERNVHERMDLRPDLPNWCKTYHGMVLFSCLALVFWNQNNLNIIAQSLWRSKHPSSVRLTLCDKSQWSPVNHSALPLSWSPRTRRQESHMLKSTFSLIKKIYIYIWHGGFCRRVPPMSVHCYKQTHNTSRTHDGSTDGEMWAGSVSKSQSSI